MKGTQKNRPAFSLRPSEIIAIVFLSLLPLWYKDIFFRDYAALWDGTYRLYLGQIPYRDFGMPVGPGVFLLPLLFFKLGGPGFNSLVVAQVVLNFALLAAFSLVIKEFIDDVFCRMLTLLIFVAGFTSCLVIPWYNTTAVGLELFALWFLLRRRRAENAGYHDPRLIAAAFLTAFCFMTKQDCGAFAFVIGVALLARDALETKDARPVFGFIGFYVVFLGTLIAPFLKYDFFYWFSLGKTLTNVPIGRPSVIEQWFALSSLPNFYLFLIGLSLIVTTRREGKLFPKRSDETFCLIVCALIFQGIVIAATSGLPHTTGYVHAFAAAWILSRLFNEPPVSVRYRVAVGVMALLWWSPAIYDIFYAINNPRLIYSWAPSPAHEAGNPFIPVEPDYYTQLKGSQAFGDQYLPVRTVQAIEHLRSLMKETPTQPPRVLNITELSPLSLEFGFSPESDIALWFDSRNTPMDRVVPSLCDRMRQGRFDWVLMQDTHFPLPPELWQCVQATYRLSFEFESAHEAAPIRVFTRGNG